MDTKTPTAPAVTAGYLTIVDSNDVFPHTFEAFPATKFSLRVVDDDTYDRIRKQNTTRKLERGVMNDVTDWKTTTEQLMDHAIVDVDDLRIIRGGERKLVKLSALERAEQLKFKGLLPEAVKQEITRLCIGKEMGQEAAEEKKS